MYAFYQPILHIEQEEANIKDMIDEEYERRKQEEAYFFKQYEEDYYKSLSDRDE